MRVIRFTDRSGRLLLGDDGGDGTATVYVQDVGSSVALSAFAVSLETAGGSPQATPTKVVLFASIDG